MLQVRLCDKDPEQDAPPSAGDGLVQVLDLVCVPSPQVSEHVVQSEYEVQPPSTEHFQIFTLTV